MSKIICEVCGTAYPDTAAQCPICGCAKPAGDQVQPDSMAAEEAAAGYAYVKGGRFSNSNVRKRNNMAKAEALYEEDDNEEEEEPKSSNRGLTIAIIVLLLAIIAVAVYIYIRFFIPAGSGKDNKPKPTTPAVTTTVVTTTPEPTDPPVTTPEPTDPPVTTPEATTPPVDTTPDLSCTNITLGTSKVEFSSVGSTWKLNVTAEPANTTDTLVFTSADTKVATVDNTGKIVAVGEGTTTITASCGSMSAKCTVTVSIPKKDDSLRFNVPDKNMGVLYITTDEATGKVNYDAHMLKLRDANKKVLEVTNWTSSKPEICKVSKDGVIQAVSKGIAYIRCTYNGFEYTCTIEVIEKTIPAPTGAGDTDTDKDADKDADAGKDTETGTTTEGGSGSTTEGGSGSTTESGSGSTTEGGSGSTTESGSGSTTEGSTETKTE